jgi:simple sugar transport system permease protein
VQRLLPDRSEGLLMFDSALILTLLSKTLEMSAPILLAAMAGAICRQAGIVNIGLEGMMLAGAFGGVLFSYLAHSAAVGILGAILCALVLGVIFALFVLSLRGNEIVSGLGLNLLAVGLAGYILPVLFNVQGAFSPLGLQGLPHWKIPIIEDIPVLGTLLSGYDPVVYISWLSVPLTWFFLYRTKPGTHLRAAGEAEEAAMSAGINARGLKWLAVLLGAILCALAGAQLSLSQVTLFNKQMTAGRGFIALAAFYFGEARPVPTAIAALVFGFFEALQFRLQAERGISPQLIQMLPYLAVVIALVAVAVRKRLRLNTKARAAQVAVGQEA